MRAGLFTAIYTYDANSRLWTVDGPLTNDTITYDYDELGRIKTMTPESGQVVSYGYDTTLGRLSTIRQGTNTFTYAYSGNSSVLSSLTRPNGSITEYQNNDPLKRLTAILNKKSTQEIINSFAFTYNNLDLIDTETITNGEAIDNFVKGTTHRYSGDTILISGTDRGERGGWEGSRGWLRPGYLIMCRNAEQL